MKYQIQYEQSENGSWGAYVPDLPGCVAVAKSKESVERLIVEAIDLHVEEMNRSNKAAQPPGCDGSMHHHDDEHL